MRKKRMLFFYRGVFVVHVVLFSGCGSSNNHNNAASATVSQNNSANLPNSSQPLNYTGSNVIPLSVSGEYCLSGNVYSNELCAAVEICLPGTSQCQTISGLLVDTGSTGLRVYKSVLSSTLLSGLSETLVNNETVAECVQYGDGSLQWGHLYTADVNLAGQTASGISIQLIDANDLPIPASCNVAAMMSPTPANAQMNGILGIAPYASDCEDVCASFANTGWYFHCSNNSCTGITIDTAFQMQNPIGHLGLHNDGYMISFPSIPLAGASSLDGYLLLGTASASDHQLKTSAALAITNQEMTMQMGGSSYDNIIDSGTNDYILDPGISSALIQCTDAALLGYYCPTETLLLSFGFNAMDISAQINVSNASILFSSNYAVFSNTALATGAGQLNILGLPFFYGRNIVFGIEGKTSTPYNATGPFVAF